MKKYLSIMFFSILCMFLFAMPFCSAYISDAVKSGLDIALNELIPSLFPFIFFSSLLIYLGSNLLSSLFSPFLCPLFGISPDAVPAVIAGFIGGFPSGASNAAKLYSEGKICKEEAERLPVFSNNAGLMFTLGTIGSKHFGSFKAGVCIYLFHIFSSIIAGLLMKNSSFSYPDKKRESLSVPAITEIPVIFPLAVKESVFSTAVICGNFIIFKVICELLYLVFGNSFAISFFSGLLEATGGILSMPPTEKGLISASFLLSFNGLCVHMQSMTFFAPLKLSLKKLLLGKLFSAFLSGLLMYITLPGNILYDKTLPHISFYIFAAIIPVTSLFICFFRKEKCKA